MLQISIVILIKLPYHTDRLIQNQSGCGCSLKYCTGNLLQYNIIYTGLKFAFIFSPTQFKAVVVVVCEELLQEKITEADNLGILTSFQEEDYESGKWEYCIRQT